MNILFKGFLALCLGISSVKAGGGASQEHLKVQWKNFFSLAFNVNFQFKAGKNKFIRNFVNAMRIFIEDPKKIETWGNEYKNYIEFRNTTPTEEEMQCLDQGKFVKFLNNTNDTSDYCKISDYLSSNKFYNIRSIMKSYEDVIERVIQGKSNFLCPWTPRKYILQNFSNNEFDNLLNDNHFCDTRLLCHRLRNNKEKILKYIEEFPLDKKIQEFSLVKDILDLLNSEENIQEKTENLEKKINFFLKVLCVKISPKIFRMRFKKIKPTSQFNEENTTGSSMMKLKSNDYHITYKFPEPFNAIYEKFINDIKNTTSQENFIENILLFNSEKSELTNRELVHYHFENETLRLISGEKNQDEILRDLITFVYKKECITQEDILQYTRNQECSIERIKRYGDCFISNNEQTYLHLEGFLNLYIFENNFHYHIFKPLHEGLKLSMLAKNFANQSNNLVKKIFGQNVLSNILPYILGEHVIDFYSGYDKNPHGGDMNHYISQNVKMAKLFYSHRDFKFYKKSGFGGDNFRRNNYVNKYRCYLHIAKMDSLIHKRLLSKFTNYSYIEENYNEKNPNSYISNIINYIHEAKSYKDSDSE